ncbi:kinase-like protein [Xylona heveae TC161]|uniref:Kinase-like protein n=1 Tax=Xylona heveae (strain CBS 132557 / TC161) TaxID=1328760 RepID=A0A165HKE4_XYLHT|nr:kinase-like protein [Xylona heveae TC161]KZF23644.1 kinase-like protein [Xylona heveae TC161]
MSSFLPDAFQTQSPEPTAESETGQLSGSGSSKFVSLAEPQSSSTSSFPVLSISGESGDSHSNLRLPKQHAAKVAKRLTGRQPVEGSTPSIRSFASQSSIGSNSRLEQNRAVKDENETDKSKDESYTSRHQNSLLSQVFKWLEAEKVKRASRRSKNDASRLPESDSKSAHDDKNATEALATFEEEDDMKSLEELERILEENMVIGDKLSHHAPHRRLKSRPSSLFKNRRTSTGASSDTDFYDGDILVPSCDTVLDNSKTLAYSGGERNSDLGPENSRKRITKEKEAWLEFKGEILRLAHTLRLKGWRSVPLDHGGELEVERLSGALTNAVYVVSPPLRIQTESLGAYGDASARPYRKQPAKLLLRIYGPQADHLIDRQNELQILRRLARKKIGPRLLGTFTNGRFEEYFRARTLGPRDLRDPETSKQIAKRMRELHDGIDLLYDERASGPFVWRNWDKWVERCGQIVTWVDEQVLAGKNTSIKSAMKGLVCGVTWPQFCEVVGRYRRWLDGQYGGPEALKQRLVFAHNDTQYGNILRLEPGDESPLLLPANKHKQLVVIDFEYASANVPALEFANHFTEWCYNYHDHEKPYACNTAAYPTPEEQSRFIKSYLLHRPQFPSQNSATPTMVPASGPSSTISSFMLDSRGPPLQLIEEEDTRQKAIEEETKQLMKEVRLWRVANSAQWVSWGIVQAKLPEAFEPKAESPSDTRSQASRTATETLCGENPEGLVSQALRNDIALTAELREEDDEFDYLAYAQERAQLFWGDVLALGVIKEDELPVELVQQIKSLSY